MFLVVATCYLLHQGKNTSCLLDLAYNSIGTGRPPDGLCDLGVHLTTYLHLVPPIRISGDILPLSHFYKWPTANIMITSASSDKNCSNITFVFLF